MAHKKNTVDLTQVHDYGPPITLSFSLDVIIQVVIRSCLRVSSRIRSEGQNETALLSLCTCLFTKEILLLSNSCRISLFIIYIREQILELPSRPTSELLWPTLFLSSFCYFTALLWFFTITGLTLTYTVDFSQYLNVCKMFWLFKIVEIFWICSLLNWEMSIW